MELGIASVSSGGQVLLQRVDAGEIAVARKAGLNTMSEVICVAERKRIFPQSRR